MMSSLVRAAGGPVALVAALLASGCGGGGDHDAPPTAPPAIAVSSATYAAGSAQRLAYDQLNAARLRCGFGLLAQAAPLDQAAASHGNYMSINSELGHGEDPGKPGFTGATPLDRARAAGYAPRAVGEDLAAGGSFSGSTAADAVRNLMAAPYHAQSLLNGFLEVGIAWNVVASLDTLTVDLGVPAPSQLQSLQGVATFPCAGVTDAVARGGNESPSPFPSNPDAHWGQPITVAGPASLRIISATITGPAGPVALLVTYGSGATVDPNGTFTDGWFSVIPGVLQPGTSYAVAIDYTVASTPGSAHFSFATGPR
jgi:uncharacterized protein YkwD